jgi:hypothetical protein
MLPPTVQVWAADSPAPQPLAAPGLEKTINEEAGFTDPSSFRRRLAEAEVRTARIEIGGKPEGTGFLVAESLLLTNCHVVEEQVDGGVARFDHNILSTQGATLLGGRVVPFAPDWLVAHSPPDEPPRELGPDGPPVGTWDFALIRLAPIIHVAT